LRQMKPGLLVRRVWIAGPVAGAIVALAAGCGREHGNGDLAELPSLTIQAQIAERRSRLATEEEIGTVRPKLSAEMEAQVSGSIERMLAVPGESVKAGELLVKLNANEIQGRYDEVQATLNQAEEDWKRTATLYQEQAASRAEYDAAEARYRVAEGAMTEAKTMMGYVEIRAPFDGVITRKDADVGDLAVPGKPLVEMEDASHLRLEANVPEALAGNIKLGDVLAVRVDALETNFSGVASEIAPSADPNSCTFVVKLDLPAVPGLRSGQFGRVSVPTGLVSAVRVPASAVIERGDMELLFVVAEGRAHLRIIKIGARVGDEVEIVSGLDSGERVAVSGAEQLAEGQPVEVK
jgi:RND family efflux transporter MFP subunit